MSQELNCYPAGRSGPRDERRPRAELEAPDGNVPRAQDHWRVNLREDWEVIFWAREFGCTEVALREAVKAVGDCAGNVRARLLAEHQQQRN